HEPAAASELLELARREAQAGRHVLFFCSCQSPKLGGEWNCHRLTVAELVLQAARDQQGPAEIIEGPRGRPEGGEPETTAQSPRALRRGRKTLPLPRPVDLGRWAGLPWGSVATARAGGEQVSFLTGPAQYHRGWALPVLGLETGADALARLYKEEASYREDRG